MNRVLVIDDEKLARQCVKTIISNSSIEMKEILECKNGEEALKILKEKPIDVVITDICMPKIDGITLLRRIKEKGYDTKVIVVSSFDKFEYVVEVFKYGAREYILKPINEEKINEILRKLNCELIEEYKQKKLIDKLRNEHLKYYILNNDIKRDEINIIEEKYGDYIFNRPYVVCCSNFDSEPDAEKYNFINLKELNGHMTFIVDIEDVRELLNNEWRDYFVGISKKYEGIKNIRKAYKEAVESRGEAFVKNVNSYIKESVENDEIRYETIPEAFLEQFVHLISTEKLENAFRKLEMILFKGQIGIIKSEQIIQFFYNLLIEININYNNIINIDIEKFYSLKKLFLYKNVREYYNILQIAIYEIREKLLLKFKDSRNKEKINIAIVYIKENYTRNLNMAVVSNHISMNYSLFSFKFKQFTGMNFVDYLKKIRINKAKRMLEETDEKIINISKMIGYDNYKYFIKTFKLTCGVSPSEYRKNFKVKKIY